MEQTTAIDPITLLQTYDFNFAQREFAPPVMTDRSSLDRLTKYMEKELGQYEETPPGEEVTPYSIISTGETRTLTDAEYLSLHYAALQNDPINAVALNRLQELHNVIEDYARGLTDPAQMPPNGIPESLQLVVVEGPDGQRYRGLSAQGGDVMIGMNTSGTYRLPEGQVFAQFPGDENGVRLRITETEDYVKQFKQVHSEFITMDSVADTKENVMADGVIDLCSQEGADWLNLNRDSHAQIADWLKNAHVDNKSMQLSSLRHPSDNKDYTIIHNAGDAALIKLGEDTLRVPQNGYLLVSKGNMVTVPENGDELWMSAAKGAPKAGQAVTEAVVEAEKSPQSPEDELGKEKDADTERDELEKEQLREQEIARNLGGKHALPDQGAGGGGVNINADLSNTIRAAGEVTGKAIGALAGGLGSLITAGTERRRERAEQRAREKVSTISGPDLAKQAVRSIDQRGHELLQAAENYESVLRKHNIPAEPLKNLDEGAKLRLHAQPEVVNARRTMEQAITSFKAATQPKAVENLTEHMRDWTIGDKEGRALLDAASGRIAEVNTSISGRYRDLPVGTGKPDPKDERHEKLAELNSFMKETMESMKKVMESIAELMKKVAKAFTPSK